MHAEIREFVRSGVLAEEAYMAITFLAGREHHVESLNHAGAGFEVINLGENGRVESFAAMSDNDRGRLRNIWETLGFHVSFARSASIRTPMLITP